MTETYSIARTQAEIVSEIERVKVAGRGVDFFGARHQELVSGLDYEHAKPYLKDDVTADTWDGPEDPVEIILSYLKFAWKKANDCRGLSSGRSLDHLAASMWLLGIEYDYEDDYCMYGKPQLVEVSERFGFPWREHDNDAWGNEESGPFVTAEKALV